MEISFLELHRIPLTCVPRRGKKMQLGLPPYGGLEVRGMGCALSDILIPPLHAEGDSTFAKTGLHTP